MITSDNVAGGSQLGEMAYQPSEQWRFAIQALTTMASSQAITEFDMAVVATGADGRPDRHAVCETAMVGSVGM